jgi:murein DD-endopeptidase MepM/ murein hydrolase activator NlpD
MVVRVAREQGLDARATRIALAIVAQESGFNPQAEGDWSDSKNRMRSIGLFQLNEEGLGSGMGDSRYDPEANANRGIKNLLANYQKFGNLTDGEIAYNSQRPADKGAYVASINSKTAGKDPKWSGTIANTMGGMAGAGSNGAPVFPVAGQNLQTARVTTEHGAKGSNTGYAGVPETHRGTDFHAGRGSQALATVPGVVTVAHQWAGDKTDPYGNYIDIKGQDGKTYRYAHLQQLGVEQGARVGGGQTIGTVDSTGNSTGDHLHFEVIEPNGQTSDPKQFLAGSQSGSGGRGVADTSEASALVKRLEAQAKELKAKAEKSAEAAKTKQERRDIVAAEYARYEAIPRKSAKDNERIKVLDAELESIDAVLEGLKEQAKEDAALVRAQDILIGKAEEQAAGKELDPSQKEQNEASAASARAQAAKLEADVQSSKDPSSPENQGKLAQAALWRKQAENYDASTKADNALKAAQGTSALGSANQSNAQADFIRGTLDSTVAQHLAAAGLSNEQAKALTAKLQPEINNIVAQTSKLKSDAEYTRALTKAVNEKLPAEINKYKAEIRLTDAQANDLSAKLPGALVLQGTQARLDQAQAEAQRSSGIVNLATARKTEFDTQMEAWKAQRTQELSKLMANPNVTSDQLSGFLMASATNATEMVNAFNAQVAKSSAEESARAAKTRESIDIQNADETMRNNLANNVTNYMNARTNQQNASTSAMGPMLGSVRDFNALAAMGPLAGEGEAGMEGLRSIAANMGVGDSVLNGVLAGLKEYQGTIKGFKDQSPKVRMADANIATPNFMSPGVTQGAAAGAAATGSLTPPPTAPKFNLPDSVPADTPATIAAAAGDTSGGLGGDTSAGLGGDTSLGTTGAGNTPPDQMDDTGNNLPQQNPEDEEHQGGGGGFSFKAPKGHGKKKPSRAARAMGAFSPPLGRAA